MLNKLDKKVCGYTIYQILWFVIIVGFITSFLEMGWYYIDEGVWEMRTGVVIGFWQQVYGAAALLLILILYPVRNSIWKIALVGFIGGTVVEYAFSYFEEKLFGVVSWDYSDHPLNINGRVSILYSLVWAALAVIFAKLVLPWSMKLIDKIPKKIGKISAVAIAIFLVFDLALSAYCVARWNDRVKNGTPASNKVVEAIDNIFTDKYMEFVYPNMSDVS